MRGQRTGWAALIVVVLCALSGCANLKRSPDNAAPPGSCSQQQTAGEFAVTLAPKSCPLVANAGVPATITVHDAQGKAVSGATVAAYTDMPDMKMPSGTSIAVANGDAYDVKLSVGMSGKWEIRIKVTPPGGNAAEARFTYTVK